MIVDFGFGTTRRKEIIAVNIPMVLRFNVVYVEVSLESDSAPDRGNTLSNG